MSKSQPNVRSCEPRAACDDFWLKASEPSLNAIWDNPEDDVYAELCCPVGEAMSTFEEILRAALSLSPGERAMLADHLLTSLDGPNQKQIDAAWAEEIERRIREIDEGRVETIDGELVMQKLRSRFNRLNLTKLFLGTRSSPNKERNHIVRHRIQSKCQRRP